MYHCEVGTYVSQDGAVPGVAILAGVEKACDTDIQIDKRCQPIEENHIYYEKGHQLYTKNYDSLEMHYSELAEL